MAEFSWPVRIYWEDTDAGGIVFYANYLKFFERARTEWLRSLGVAQQELRERTGGMFVVSDTRTRWGSCSADGSIRLHWKLTRAPTEVLHYVALHEAAHLLLEVGVAIWIAQDRQVSLPKLFQ